MSRLATVPSRGTVVGKTNMKHHYWKQTINNGGDET